MMKWTPEAEEALFLAMWEATPREYRYKPPPAPRYSEKTDITPGRCVDCNVALDNKNKARCNECKKQHKRAYSRKYMRKFRQTRK